MAISNGYCTVQELVDEIYGTDAGSSAMDTAVMERIIEDASRAIDAYCGGRRFYATYETHYCDYPVPYAETLYLDDDLLTLSSVTNGDGASIAGSALRLWPRAALAKAGVTAPLASGLAWYPDGADTQEVIAVSGSWGYVDRGASIASIASNARSLHVIDVTRRACLIVARDLYRKRTGQGEMAAQVTPAGVVLTPQGMPQDAAQMLEGLRRQW